ncbi:MAG TPA: hypothetical protein VGB76_11545 [Pyrinomonadaceae bacterium]|jgi:hypothetical protein
MEETQKIFEPTPVGRPTEGEETLVSGADGTLQTPRFDEVEAQVARPVVPLAGNFTKRGGVRRRQWPIALVLISALAGGVVSLLAFRLYQQRQQQSQVAEAQTETQTPETNAAANADSMPPVETATTQADAPVVFEEFDPAKEGVPATGVDSNGGGGEAKPADKPTEAEAKPPAAVREERKEEAKPAPRAAEPKPRLVETLTPPRQVEARGENVSRDERRNDDEEYFEERRERRRERRNQRREERRGRNRNIDRIKDIFEGPPPA